MKLSPIITSTGEWLSGSGPESQIVISSRVRLARNLEAFPFPDSATKEDCIIMMQSMRTVIEELPEMKGCFSERLSDLTLLEKQLLVERHLISCEHAAKREGSAVVMNKAQTVSIMINEEDHLRMQAIRSGLRLQEVFQMVSQIDSKLEEHLAFAFDEQYGYITACPSNVGTGMRASVMMHLPALVLTDQVDKIVNAVGKMGIAVRGLHGEGTDAVGNLFQISNQTTLGDPEEVIIDRLNQVIHQILEHEKNARKILRHEKTEILLDQIGRGYGVLSHAYFLTTKEALNYLSLLKLGLDLHLFPKIPAKFIDELSMEVQPAHLQKAANVKKMNAVERDSLRATIIRLKMELMPRPSLSE